MNEGWVSQKKKIKRIKADKSFLKGYVTYMCEP